MSIADSTREAHRGYPPPAGTMQGGAYMPPEGPHDAFGPSAVTITPQGNNIVPVSAVGRQITIRNEGYCRVRLGADTTSVRWDTGGYALDPRETFVGTVRGQMAAVVAPGSLGRLSIVLGTP